jgi:hypothetical protein
MNINDYEKTLGECLEMLKDFSKFKHLFSDDEGERTLAKIYETVGLIKFQIDLSKTKKVGHPRGEALMEHHRTGKLVAVRPCAKEFEGKTFLGVYIGVAALGSSVRIEEDAIVCEWTSYNPAILIPELGKIVYGCGSWWRVIRSEDDLKTISDSDIENIWYVKALRQTEGR